MPKQRDFNQVRRKSHGRARNIPETALCKRMGRDGVSTKEKTQQEVGLPRRSPKDVIPREVFKGERKNQVLERGKPETLPTR